MTLWAKDAAELIPVEYEALDAIIGSVAALEDFETSVRADTAFALAYYRLAVAADWASQMPLVLPAAQHAARLTDRLGQHDKMLVVAHLAWREQRIDDAERCARRDAGRGTLDHFSP